jgi:hypothetical protein
VPKKGGRRKENEETGMQNREPAQRRPATAGVPAFDRGLTTNRRLMVGEDWTTYGWPFIGAQSPRGQP